MSVCITLQFSNPKIWGRNDFSFILTISSLQQGKSTSALLSSNVSLAKYVNIYGEWLCHFVVHIQKCVLGYVSSVFFNLRHVMSVAIHNLLNKKTIHSIIFPNWRLWCIFLQTRRLHITKKVFIIFPSWRLWCIILQTRRLHITKKVFIIFPSWRLWCIILQTRRLHITKKVFILFSLSFHSAS
jgi:hypothetical protein